MNIQQRIDILVELGNRLISQAADSEEILIRAKVKNPWFTPEQTKKRLKTICTQFLNKNKIENWLATYPHFQEPEVQATVALLLAEDIPLSGFQDFTGAFLSGHTLILKGTDKNETLWHFILENLIKINPELKGEISWTKDPISGFDAIIVAPQNMDSNKFKTYFKKYPSIIRQQQFGIGILSGKESKEQLIDFGKDIFDFFGLGERSVSKIYIPREYDFDLLVEALHEYKEIVWHNKYKNNYDYNYTLYILNKINIIPGTCLLLVEDKGLNSRIATLHYEYYDDLNDLSVQLTEQKSLFSCIVAGENIPNHSVIPFGHTHQEELIDWPDGQDTFAFLIELNHFTTT